jgi:tetratricopeptide (TPR) repeat protein
MRPGRVAAIVISPGSLSCGLGLALLLAGCSLVARPAIGQAGDYARAEAMVREHRWDDGLALLATLLKSEPRNAKALNLAGLALTGKGEIQTADEYFDRCLQANPGFVPALKNLSINEFNEKQYAAAEKHLLTAAKAMPDDPVVNLYLGEIAYRQQKYQSAADGFSRARDLALRSPNAAAHLAVSDLKTGQQDKALEILDQIPPEAIEPPTQFALGLELERLNLPQRSIAYLEAVRQRFPDSYDIGFDLMLDDIAAKQYERAILVAEDLIARGRETSELNNVLAEAYEGNNQIQHAVDALRRAIALDPADEENYLDFASLCMDQRSLQAGMRVIQVALESHPKSDRLIFMRGVLHAMQDEFELAEKDFKLSADLAPQTNFGYIGLGVAYLETGHDAQAIQVLRQRLREKPNDASLLYLLGEGLIRTGAAPATSAYAEAQAVLEKSVFLNPNLCLPHVSLGTIYLDEDRPKEAADQFEEARAIDPKERSAYSHLAVAYRRLGQVDKAKETLNSLKEVIEQERRSTREKMKTAAGETVGDGTAEKNP